MQAPIRSGLCPDAPRITPAPPKGHGAGRGPSGAVLWSLPAGLAGCCGFGSKARAGRASLKALDTRNLVKRGEILPAQPVPEGIVAPPYVADPDQVRGWWNSRIVPKTDSDIEAMRSAGELAHAALDLAADLIKPGVTTEQMDKELHTFICDHGAYPSDLLYKGFPKSVMISINEALA